MAKAHKSARDLSKSICALIPRDSLFADSQGWRFTPQAFNRTLESFLKEKLASEISEKQVDINTLCVQRSQQTLDDLRSKSWPTISSADQTKNIEVVVKFKDQPAPAWGTGFSIGDGLVVTAGHCARPHDLQQVYAVFDFTLQSLETGFSKNNVFEINRSAHASNLSMQFQANQIQNYPLRRGH